MSEHCKDCNGTGRMANSQACLTCAGTGIKPEDKPAFQPRRVGPFHTYPTFKRDLMIIVGLVILLLILNGGIKIFG